MKTVWRNVFFSVFLAVFYCAPLSAETVTVPITQQGADLKNMPLPATGSSKSAVLKRFGEPLNRVEPVGKPPISKWLYDNYTVYFEYDHVIHSVLNHSS
jgi:hypothetical protein